MKLGIYLVVVIVLAKNIIWDNFWIILLGIVCNKSFKIKKHNKIIFQHLPNWLQGKNAFIYIMICKNSFQRLKESFYTSLSI